MINTKDLEFQKYCKHCKYMKRYKGYTQELFASRYFDSNGDLTLSEVTTKYNVPINKQTIYKCLRTHFPQYNKKLAPFVDSALTNTIELIEAGPNAHVEALDRFIVEGDRKLQSGEMAITASTYIAAINTKANIEKSQKDRKLDLIRDFFGAKGDTDGPDNEDTRQQAGQS